MKISPAFNLLTPEDRQRYEELKSEETDIRRQEREFLLVLAKRDSAKIEPKTLDHLRTHFPGLTDVELTGLANSRREEFTKFGELVEARFAQYRKFHAFICDVDRRYLGLEPDMYDPDAEGAN